MAETGQLPTSGSSTDVLSGAFDKLQGGITNEDIKQALSPTMQRGPIQLPSYFTTPRAQVQPPAQLDHREVIGAGNARAQGIGNAVSAGVRTLGNFMAVRKNQQQAAEATKVQRFLSAQYEGDQATQILQNDPKNQQALTAQKQARDLMTGMLTDKKFATTLEKGFQISLTDPSQNKTEHHNIVQKGIELFKKQHQQPFNQDQAQQMLQKFRAQMPQQLGPNQYKLQELQTKAALQKSQNEFLGKVYPAIIRAQGAKELARFASDSKYRLEQYKQGNENARAFGKILGEFERDRQKNMDARNLAILKADLITKRLDHLIGQAAIQPGKLIPERNGYDQSMSKLEIDQQNLIAGLTADRDKYQQGKGVDKSTLDAKNKAIYSAEQDLQKIKDTHGVGIGQFDDLISGKVTFGGKPIDSTNKSGSGSGNDGGAASTGNSEAGPADQILNAGSLNEIYQQLMAPDDTDSSSSNPDE